MRQQPARAVERIPALGRQVVAIAIGFALFARATAASEEAPGLRCGPMDLSLEELGLQDHERLQAGRAAEPQCGRGIRDHRRGDAPVGLSSVAEALRMAPGVQVARSNASTWAIGARGFNTGLSNKLLVLIDGRSVYSPLFSGVFWELQDVPVEDIERIEVIRGPGAALWGANAVNGVINIITRRAAEAAGWTVKGGGRHRGARRSAWCATADSLGHNADFRLSGERLRTRRADTTAARPTTTGGCPGARGAPTGRPSERRPGHAARRGLRRRARTSSEPGQPGRPARARRSTSRATAAAASGLSRWEHDLGGRLRRGAPGLVRVHATSSSRSLREQRHTADLDLQHHFRALGTATRSI